MIKMCSACSVSINFNDIDLCFSEMRRLYWIEFINAYTHTEKEYINKYIYLLVKYIYICIKFLMYEVLLWQLKFVSTSFISLNKVKLLKTDQKCYLFYQKNCLCPWDFCTFFFPSFFLCYPLLILQIKLIDDTFWSLWHHHFPKLDSKNIYSLIYGE